VKRIVNRVGLIFTLLAVGYFLYYSAEHVKALPSINWNLTNIIVIPVAVALYELPLLVGGFVWYRLLKAMGEPVRLGQSLIIYGLAQFAKYIPGNIGHHIGRIAISRTYGLKIPKVILSMSIEFGWSISAGLFVTLGSMFISGYHLPISILQLQEIWQLIYFGCAVMALPLLVLWGVRCWISVSFQSNLVQEDVSMPSGAELLAVDPKGWTA